MLSEEQNRLLTQTGKGTPMGDLLRRYWMPIAAISEIDEIGIKAVRLMGEDLVLYKDQSGNYGLIDRHCPHRRADMLYGFAESCGLRCHYHGWLFDHEGRCLEQPFEQTENPKSTYRDNLSITAYPVRHAGGLLWGYLGPLPAPELPDWEFFGWQNTFVQIVTADIPCNWLQCQENSIDPIHFEWAHSNWAIRSSGKPGPYSPEHRKIGFEEFEHGFIYKRIKANTDENDPYWTMGRICLWPNAFLVPQQIEYRVPVDDENTLSIVRHISRVPIEREPYFQGAIPYWHGPVKDPVTGRWIHSHIANQDFVAWAGQGRIADRTKEHLGVSDRGIVMVRRRFLDDLKRIDRGEDPKAVIRDPAANKAVELPISTRDRYLKGEPMEKMMRARDPRGYKFQYGQPDHVKQLFEEAMGFPVAPD